MTLLTRKIGWLWSLRWEQSKWCSNAGWGWKMKGRSRGDRRRRCMPGRVPVGFADTAPPHSKAHQRDIRFINTTNTHLSGCLHSSARQNAGFGTGRGVLRCLPTSLLPSYHTCTDYHRRAICNGAMLSSARLAYRTTFSSLSSSQMSCCRSRFTKEVFPEPCGWIMGKVQEHAFTLLT
jgi:hypothetical protein